jgi:hypothetical protein
MKKILFYTNNLRTFRSNLIGYLYEISQVYPVVLLSEKLDSKTENLLKDKNLFPKLEEIVHVGQYDQDKGIWKKQASLCNSAKMFVEKYEPDIVIAPGSFFFESYLRRFASKKGALTINFMGLTPFRDIKEYISFRMGLSIYSATPSFLPMFVRRAFIMTKKIIGQFFYYWILPISAGQMPFVKTPSSIFWWDFSRSRGADYFLVFSGRDKDILTDNGMPKDKIIVLAHSLVGSGEGRKFLRDVYVKKDSKLEDSKRKIMTIMWPALPTMYIKGEGYKIISEKDTEDFHAKNVKTIVDVLKDWKIFIKPHPMVKGEPYQFKRIHETLEPLSKLIAIADPDESAEDYIERSDVIMGFQPACTTLFTASIQCPEKPIFALDLKGELMADFYKDFKGVEYIDNEKRFVDILKLIRDNKYKKSDKEFEKSESSEKEFSNAVELLEYLSQKNA